MDVRPNGSSHCAGAQRIRASESSAAFFCPSTDPGWTPLFLTAGGLVMEMGGANSHGAVVAREYGIPAVLGTGVATQRLSSGQRIRVDGDAGTVTIERGSGPGTGGSG